MRLRGKVAREGYEGGREPGGLGGNIRRVSLINKKSIVTVYTERKIINIPHVTNAKMTLLIFQ